MCYPQAVAVSPPADVQEDRWPCSYRSVRSQQHVRWVPDITQPEKVAPQKLATLTAACWQLADAGRCSVSLYYHANYANEF